MPLLRRAASGLLAALSLAVAQPAAAQTAAGDWSGPYLGFAAGAKLGDATWTATQLNGGGDALTPFTPVDGSSPRSYDLTGARIGGYAGFNWQDAAWVFGPEIDFGWSNIAQDKAYLPGCAPGCGGFFPTPGPNDTAAVRLKWDIDITGRGGYLVAPGVLLYGKAGLALQQAKTTGVCLSPTDNSAYCFTPGPQSPIAHDLTLVGFTVGGGLETKLWDNWLLRGEYRFSYFPSVDDTLGFQPSTTGLDNTYRYRLSAQTHTFTLGLAYRF
ncbi:MAG TPA: outer membrane beta-barrel protein [Stellaceae bacterium]|nr:outer membrane beta-barrel protein [Stellaceae bacterium]